MKKCVLVRKKIIYKILGWEGVWGIEDFESRIV